MRRREIGERCIAGDALGEFKRGGKTLAVFHQMMRQPDGVAFFGGERAAGQHHFHDAGRADQRRQPHRGAAAHIDAAAALRQRIECRALGDAHMRGRRKLEPAADHRAVQHGDDRRLAEFDMLEGAVPGARMLDAGAHVALRQFGQIEARGKMLAVAVEHDGADVLGQRGKERLDARHGRIVERVAFFGAHQGEHRHVAAALGAQRGRQLGKALVGIRLVHARPAVGAPFDPVGRAP